MVPAASDAGEGSPAADATSAAVLGSFDPFTEYSFQVKAFSWSSESDSFSGFSLPSDVATVTTPAVPAVPTGLTATAVSTTQVDLAWTDNATDATAYEVRAELD